MIYLDNGATTFPKPQSVIRAVTNTMQRFGANPGRSGHNMSIRASEIMFDCRRNVASLFGTDSPENVIFTNNCTTALNTVIKGTLKRGDHAVISSLEHNAVVRPLEAMRGNGVEYSVAEVVEGDDEATINNFRNSFKSNTRLVICTHASNVFGIKLPIERIAALCRINGILFCLDAAQTAGVIPIDLGNSCIDYLCTAGHKGLYGPMGTGVLIINSKTTPVSLIQGGTGSFSSNKEQPDILPDKYESGTPNLPGIAGLNEGVKFVMRKTPEQIDRYEMSLAKQLYNRLKNIRGIKLYTKQPDSDSHVPVISFNVNGADSEKIAAELNGKYNTAVRAGLHCAPLAHSSYNTIDSGTVRAVISVFNNRAEIDYFANSINKIAKLT